jgi:hypothetical protein
LSGNKRGKDEFNTFDARCNLIVALISLVVATVVAPLAIIVVVCSFEINAMKFLKTTLDYKTLHFHVHVSTIVVMVTAIVAAKNILRLNLKNHYFKVVKIKSVINTGARQGGSSRPCLRTQEP